METAFLKIQEEPLNMLNKSAKKPKLTQKSIVVDGDYFDFSGQNKRDLTNNLNVKELNQSLNAFKSENSKIQEEQLFLNVEQSSFLDFDLASDSILSSDLLESFSTNQEDKKVYEDKCLATKLLQSEEDILDNYCQLKQIILGYKGVKSRISTNFDTFSMGKTQLFKLSTSGKSLKLYLNLDYDTVETRLKAKYVGDKSSYKSVPVLLKVKSKRGLKNAIYLIEEVAKNFSLEKLESSKQIDCVQLLKDYYNIT